MPFNTYGVHLSPTVKHPDSLGKVLVVNLEDSLFVTDNNFLEKVEKENNLCLNFTIFNLTY